MTTRLLHIVPTLRRGGIEEQLLLLAQHLSRDVFQQHVCALSSGGDEHLAAELAELEISVSRCTRRPQVDPLCYWRMFQELRRMQPDIVHFWRPDENVGGRIVAKLAEVRTIVETRHSADHSIGRLKHACGNWLANCSQAVSVPHTSLATSMIAEGFAADRVRTILPGVAIPSVDASLSAVMPGRKQVLEQLGLPAHARYVVGIGQLVAHNRWKDAIWSADLLKVLYDDVHLVLIGRGPLRPQLERFRRKACIADRVHMMGFVDDLEPILRHATCLWSPSGRAGVRMSILFGMASGIPVVACETPVNRQITHGESCGFLLPMGDRAGVARQTCLLLDDPSLRLDLGAVGRRLAEQEFGVEQVVDGYQALYRQAKLHALHTGDAMLVSG